MTADLEFFKKMVATLRSGEFDVVVTDLSTLAEYVAEQIGARVYSVRVDGMRVDYEAARRVIITFNKP